MHPALPAPLVIGKTAEVEATGSECYHRRHRLFLGANRGMPLLDRFHPLLTPARHWEAFHSRWASSISDALNRDLPSGRYFAEPQLSVGGRIEIDVATLVRRLSVETQSALCGRLPAGAPPPGGAHSGLAGGSESRPAVAGVAVGAR